MISFRTHVVTLVAVFLALAVGVVLGGGPLSELGRGEGENTEALEAQVRAAESKAAFADGFASDLSSTVVDGALEDRRVAMVAFPGADEAVVDGLSTMVEQAGGSVTAVQEIGTSLINPGEKALVDTLGAQLLEQIPAGSVTSAATTYERAGELIALTVASTREDGEPSTPETKAVGEGLTGANLVPQAADVDVRAPLVLVVLGDEVEGDGADEIVAGLLRGLAQRSVGTVVAATSASVDGQLERLRSTDVLGDAASVDGIEVTAGQISAILGLERALEATGGNFGATGSDGSVPLR